MELKPNQTDDNFKKLKYQVFKIEDRFLISYKTNKFVNEFK